jgi:hypothetical protein
MFNYLDQISVSINHFLGPEGDQCGYYLRNAKYIER